MRKRIERSAIEIAEFFDEIDWNITNAERKLIKSADYIDKYKNYYKDTEESFEKAEKVTNFFYEPEPDYKDWIGEDCIFSDCPFDIIINCEAHDGILIYFKDGKFINNIQDIFSYCMLKKDYVKLIKEQIK